MSPLLRYGLRHRIPVAAISAFYAAVGIVFHEEGQDFVRLIQREALWMWWAVVVGLAGLGYWVVRMKEELRASALVRRVWLGLLVTAVAGYLLLMSYPTEVVHYLQYGILSILLAIGIRGVAPAFVLTCGVGILDEAYQYWWLHRSWGVYFDFNDVLLNIVAAALGLATAATLWTEIFVEDRITAEAQGRREKRLGFNSAHVFALTLAALFAVGVWAGFIAIQSADVREHTLLLLNRMPPFETFWETFGSTVQQHHVVRAWWGIILTGLMTIGGIRVVEKLRRESGGLSSFD